MILLLKFRNQFKYPSWILHCHINKAIQSHLPSYLALDLPFDHHFPAQNSPEKLILEHRFAECP